MAGSTDVHLRPFQRGDLVPLAEAWTRAAPLDPITPDRLLRLVLLDRNADPSGLTVAVLDGSVVGAASCVRRVVAEHGGDLEPGLAWLPFFFVDPRAGGRGIGRALVRRTMAWARERGAHRIRFSDYTPGYVLPGLDRHRYAAADRLLASLGFHPRTDVVAMERRLTDHRVPGHVRERQSGLAANGIHFHTPAPEDLPGLVRLAGQFSYDWARAIREAVLGDSPLERILVATRHRGDTEGEPVGWAMCGTYEGVLERFGPFGVRPEERGSGIGEVLLHLTLERMRALGAHSAWFLWTGLDTPAGRLYLRAGFEVTRTFTLLEAELAP